MTDKELNIRLREMAREAGLCDEWYAKWTDDDTIDDCLQRFINGHDFAVKLDWPPLDFIRENFRLEDLHRHHIYLDEEVSLNESESGYYIFLGHCTGTAWFTGFVAVTIYMRHDSNIWIDAFDGARVMTMLYDKSKSKSRADRYSRVQTLDRRTQ